MNILIFLWIALSAVLLVLFVWTNLPLIDQKKAWREFAKKHNFKYFPVGFLKSPVVVEEDDQSNFRLFSEEQYTSDLAGRRFSSVLEWILPAMPCSGIIASQGMEQLIGAASITDRITSPPGGWRKQDFIIAETREELLPYLTEARMNIFRKLVAIRNTRFLFAFDMGQAVLRLETNDPLLDSQKISALYTKLRKAIGIIMPTEEDFRRVELVRRELEAQKEADLREEERKREEEEALAEASARKPDLGKKRKIKVKAGTDRQAGSRGGAGKATAETGKKGGAVHNDSKRVNAPGGGGRSREGGRRTGRGGNRGGNKSPSPPPPADDGEI